MVDLISREAILERLHKASLYYGGEGADVFDEGRRLGLLDAQGKIVDQPSVKAVPIEVLQEIKAESIKLKLTVELAKSCFTKDQRDAYRAAINNVVDIVDRKIKEAQDADCD